MAIKKTLLMAGVIASMSAITLAGIGTVAADTNGTGLAEKIAQKFNVNQDEVQNVLDEHHEDKEAEHREKLEDKLSQAVTDGELTEDQKAKILAKIDELKASREANKGSMKDMPKEERKELMENKREELKKWAEENGIPEESLHFLMPRHGRGHGGLGHHRD